MEPSLEGCIYYIKIRMREREINRGREQHENCSGGRIFRVYLVVYGSGGKFKKMHSGK